MIAATSRDLSALVREGKFREDLYYRLNVLPLRVPPLRERRADIAALVELLGDDMAASGTPLAELSADALALLGAQEWRGNVRELRNVLEQLALRGEGAQIDAQQVAQLLSESGVAPTPGSPVDAAPAAPTAVAVQALRPLAQQVAELEQAAIAAVLAVCSGNKVQAAKQLGISRAKLYARMSENTTHV